MSILWLRKYLNLFDHTILWLLFFFPVGILGVARKLNSLVAVRSRGNDVQSSWPKPYQELLLWQGILAAWTCKIVHHSCALEWMHVAGFIVIFLLLVFGKLESLMVFEYLLFVAKAWEWEIQMNTPWKIDMEFQNHPLEMENITFHPPPFVSSMLIFQGAGCRLESRPAAMRSIHV